MSKPTTNGRQHLHGLRQAATDIHIDSVEMTPAKAMELLANADPNRTVHERRVSALARDMIAGRWRLNAENIKIAPDGKLIDGEHRLWAVVRAEEHGVKSVPMMVAFNVPREARQTIDTGKPRSYADVLKIRGYSGKGRFFASTLRYIAAYKAGVFRRSHLRSVMMTHEEIDAMYADRDTMNLLEFFEASYMKGMRYAPATGFVFWRASQDDAALAQEWAAGVQTGVDMKADDPRYQLRERFHEPTKRSLEQFEAIALAIKSWNLFSLGETVQIGRAHV